MAIFASIGTIALERRRSAAEEPPSSFADWLRALYLGEIALREAVKQDSGTGLSDRELQALFTPEIQAELDQTRNHVMPATEAEGPILDFLLGWGALPNRKIELVAVTPDGEARARVDLAIAGNPRRLALTGVFDPLLKTWRIDDIDYGDGGPDRTLRLRLARMMTWKQR